MAVPLTPARLLDALRAEGLRVVEHRDWRRHHRNHKGAWGPVNGVMVHHTVTRGTDASVDLCYHGHSGLPGPLCHGVVDKAGTVHLVGGGRANHAGLGDGHVLRSVIAEVAPPRPRRDDTDGNARFYGFEAINLGDGRDPWPEEQLDAIARSAAAICRAHGWNERSVIAHKEWTRTKIDPRGFSMDGMRSRVAARLGSPAAGSGAGGPSAGRPALQPFPGAAWFRGAPRSPIVTAMGRRLVAEGCSRYAVGPGPQWTDADRRSYAAWQRRLGFTGADADGWPGEVSWRALRVPRAS
ncbi:N-acetylmuramoyl-L-alanine amidase [Streptomyces sp. TRM43335]|uniref:N-acetylmuramoyl-L-alanine amidase n=1 Tax=Streptomyces taklimakanensis TaxID=2569853 RepID=A0A6G2BB96_9ACTN|nr:peptidoglycan-binding protein [Streptomyces taklimakanensis]MTE19494.1 N-acetylmuramoyl-L-alanine amidase [Streptomyces taklimakanensis]